MKKIGLFFIILLLSASAFAEVFDVNQYTYDELKAIQEQINARISELERQYAIEHGDRKITFENDAVLIYAGRSYTVEPIVTRIVDDAPQRTTFVYSTSDPSIAKVSNHGRVDGVSTGTATITATAKDNDCIFGSFTVQVLTPIKSVTTSNKDITLFLGDKESSSTVLNYEISPTDAVYDTLTWSSSNTKIVTVDENGQIVGHEAGRATVTAAFYCAGANEKNKRINYNIQVVQPVESVSLNETSLTLNKGKSISLKSTVLPIGATNKTVKWSSSDTNIATVSSSGHVSARNCGTCTITCTTADGTNIQDSCIITVKQLINSISFKERKITLGLNQRITNSPIINPKDATETTLKWSSSNPTVATVSDSGIVYGVKGGDCVITCTAIDGSQKSASYNVHIPTFSVSQTDYSVSRKDGLNISVITSGISIHSLEISEHSGYFDAFIKDGKLFISPIRAGSGTITLKYNNDRIQLNIRIEHSAVYDSASYPKASYSDILRNPSSYKGDAVHIYGKVLQKTQYGSKIVLRVGTSGYGMYDSVFWVEYNADDVDVSVIEDDYVTIYGHCTGSYTYETVMRSSLTIPSMDAEKIILGK